MAKVVIPAQTATQVSAGTANDLIIANGGGSRLMLNTTDPSADGAAVTLGPFDSVVMSAGGAWAAAVWVGWSAVGTTAIVTSP
jgi:hypothetical protein